jgi:hypothetical protein
MIIFEEWPVPQPAFLVKPAASPVNLVHSERGREIGLSQAHRRDLWVGHVALETILYHPKCSFIENIPARHTRNENSA